MKLKTFLKKLAKAYQVKRKYVKANSSFMSIEGLDSAGHVGGLCFLDEEFGVIPSYEEYFEWEGVADIINYLGNRIN